MRPVDTHSPRLLILLTLLLVTPVRDAPARTPATPPRPPGVLGSGLYAIRAPYLFQHDAGFLTLQVTNVGMFGNPYITDRPSAGWRGGEYLYFSTLWIGAHGADGEPHVSTGAPAELRPELSAVWTVYESRAGARGGERLGEGISGDDDGDGLVDEDFRDGLDNDGDGRIDEDFGQVGAQMLSCVYRDDTNEAIAQVPDHVPLGVLVRQRSFEWSTDDVNEFVGVDFRIINDGDQNLHQVYLGIFCDSDVGPGDHENYWLDDLAGWDEIDSTVVLDGPPGLCSTVNLSLDAAFMWDAADASYGTAGGDVPGVFGSVILGHTTDPGGLSAPARVGANAIHWFRNDAPDFLPGDDVARYQLMSTGGFESGNARPGVASASTATPGDYSYVVSVGPFPDLDPGESIDLEMAYVVGEGFSGFRRNVVAAARVGRGAYVNADSNPVTGMYGKETCLRVLHAGDVLYWDDPCDTTSNVISIRSTTCYWVDNDCNPCSGVDGKETHVPWIAWVAPPDPATNLDPRLNPEWDPNLSAYVPPGGNGRVTLQWDNAPECYVDEWTRVRYFEGYRIWRIDDWQGDWVGPGDPEWVELAEFRRNPTGDAQDLRTVLDHDVDPVGVTEDGCSLYPIGRYVFVDTSVVNGVRYRYAVTAFGLCTSQSGVTEIANLPYTPPEFAVTPCDSCGPVPVRLASFTVMRDGSGAVVRWSVAEAVDHAGFEVYRREEGAERVRLDDGLLSGRTDYEFRDPAAPPGRTEYWLRELSRSGVRTWIGPVVLPAAVGVPGRFSAGRAVPNPFSGRMSLAYSLPETRRVQVAVHDLQGRVVRRLVDEVKAPGTHTATWEGRTDAGGRAAAGWYLITVRAGVQLQVRKVVLLE